MALILIVISLLGLVNNPITPAQAESIHTSCSNTNFTPNGTYQKNLNTLLASLPSIAANTAMDGFANRSVGRAHGQFLCRGDLSKDQCHDCVKNATQKVVQECPRGKTSIIWYDECMLRYSNESFSLRGDTEPSVSFYNMEKINNDTARFTRLVNYTVKGLATRLAASGGISRKMFEAAAVNFTSSDTLYAFAQCIPLISAKKCSSCLMQRIEELAFCCNTSKGGRVLNPRCNVRFELYSFYNTSVLSSLAPEPAPWLAPFPSPPAEPPVEHPPAPGEAPVPHPAAPADGPAHAPSPGSPSEVPPPGGSVGDTPPVATSPGPGFNGNSKEPSSTLLTMAAPVIVATSLVLINLKF